MNWRTTAVLFLILVALGGYLYYDSQQEETAVDEETIAEPTVAAPAIDQTVPLLDGAIANDVRQLDITRAEDGVVATFSHDGLGDWQQVAPTAQAVLTTTLTTQVTGFINLTSNRVFSSTENPLSAYGLDAPAYTIGLNTLAGDGTSKAYTLSVGNETPTNNGYYVQKPGDPRVYVVAKGSVDNMINLIDNPPLPTEES
ncbi:MAG: DUF4340 domain-containing protein [Chloroflexota bacterium]